MFWCRLLTFFFKINLLKIKSFRNTITVSNSLDPEIRTDVLSVLIWVQNVCKGHQPTTKVATRDERWDLPVSRDSILVIALYSTIENCGNSTFSTL